MKNEKVIKIKTKENPFTPAIINNFFIKSNKNTGLIESSAKSLIDNNSGELSSVSLTINKSVVIDNQQFSKLYNKASDLLMDLIPEGVKLLGFILKELEKDKDYIILDRIGFLERNNYKTNMSFYKGVNALIEVSVISVSNIGNKYWINPYYFFNGDRTKLIKK